MKVSVILLAGGLGSRMGGAIPKQFLPLGKKIVAEYSLEVFLELARISHNFSKMCEKSGPAEVVEIILVCPTEFRHLFSTMPVQFAQPGKRRQDSVYNGLKKASSPWICIHDAARPFLTCQLVKKLFNEGAHTEAASLAMPVKNALKEIDSEEYVARTLERSTIWEIQTPQLIKKEILQEGFTYARSRNLSVTDDVSLAELVGCAVKLVRGSYQNIKLTTKEDLDFAEWIIQQNIECVLPTMEPAIVAGKSSQIVPLFKG